METKSYFCLVFELLGVEVSVEGVIFRQLLSLVVDGLVLGDLL
jgi:hypothetical protein